MKALMQTAFVVFVLFLMSFSVVYAQDPAYESDDDTTTDEMTEETTDENSNTNTTQRVWGGSLYETLIALSAQYRIDMIITPETEQVQVRIYLYKEIEKKALEKSEELNGVPVIDFDILLDMILDTYGYSKEIREEVYIIKPKNESKIADEKLVTETRPFDIPKYFRFSEIVEQFSSFLGEGDKIISNLNSRVIFVMASQGAINRIDEYFKVIDAKADKGLDYSVEELSGVKAKAEVTDEKVDEVVIKKQIYRFTNAMEQVLVDLRNLLPVPMDSEYEPWTIINEEEKLVLITGTDDDLKMVEEYIRQMKLTQGGDIEVPLAEKIDTRVYTLGRPVEEVSKDLKPFLTSGGVIVSNPEKNFIIVKDKVTNFVLLERFIQELDAEPQQVYIEATFMELKLDHDFRFGIDSEWNKNIGSLDWSFGTPDVTAGYSLGVLQGTEWSMKLNSLSTNTDSNILSRPRVLIKNGKQAKIVVGQEVPYLTTDESDGGETQKIEFKDVSITMSVTPHVEPGERVRMEIKISIKEQIGTVSLAGNETPITSNRELNTEVFVKSGNTLIMGGLYENKVTENLTTLPVIGELPIIGMLFSTQYDTNRKTDLLFFITPTIVKPKDEVDIIRKGRVLKFYKNMKPVAPVWLNDPAARKLSK